MKTKITKTSVKNATPKIKDAYLWDTELTGFGLKITPAGRKTFIYQYRLLGSPKTDRFTIGRYLDRTSHNGKDQILSVRIARQKAEILRGRINSGFDPKAEQREKANSLYTNDVLDDFVKDHVESKSKLKPRTSKGYKSYITNDIKPRFKGLKLSDINRSDISKFHSENSNTPSKANHIYAILSKFFNWCEERNLRTDGSNPCRHVKKYTIKPRERFLTQKEDIRLSNVLDAAHKNGTESLFVIAAIQLLRLTGARKMEILTLQWEWVDLENRVINLPDSKTGKKTIYLNSKAVEILRSLPKLDGNPFVIAGLKHGSHVVNIQKAWTRIRNKAGLDDVRIHDLRHTFASFAVESGMSLHTVGSLLGHKQASTTFRYAHLADSRLKEAIETLGGRIAN